MRNLSIKLLVKGSLYPALLTLSRAHWQSKASADILKTKSQIRYIPSAENHVFNLRGKK